MLVRVVVVLVLGVFTATYRFNTLGGSLGGFDDDHFVHFAYAKQVQAGEQPLRDFDGLGLQGAWPSLTYDASAAAQAILGDTLRAEALLTVGALTLAAGLTFYAAAALTSTGWALAATTLTVLLAPKLYNYPKVLLLALAVFCVVLYARRRSLAVVAALAVVTAAAFLFRHDYSVYVASSAAVVLAAGAGGLRRASGHLGAYAALTLLLLTPSLVYVQRYAGLVQYVRDGLEQSRNEAGRTELQWPTFRLSGEGDEPSVAGALSAEENAVAWLYYLHLALPALALATLLRRDSGDAWARPALMAIGVSALFVNPLLLRGNVGARLGDVGPLAAVLLAACAQRMTGWGGGSIGMRTARVVGVAAVLAVSVRAVWAVGSVASELDTSGWSDSSGKVTGQAARRWDELGALPAGYWSGEQPTDSLRLVQYLHECTSPGDRVVVMSYQPELLPLADRRFGAGRAAIVPDLLSDDAHERVMLERWQRQRIPIVLTEPDDTYRSDYPEQYALLHAHLQANYESAGTLAVDGGTLRVLRDRRLTPVRTFGAAALPCFR